GMRLETTGWQAEQADIPTAQPEAPARDSPRYDRHAPVREGTFSSACRTMVSGNGDRAGHGRRIDEIASVVGGIGHLAAEVRGRRGRGTLTRIEVEVQDGGRQATELEHLVFEAVARDPQHVRGAADTEGGLDLVGRVGDRHLALRVVDEHAQ